MIVELDFEKLIKIRVRENLRKTISFQNFSFMKENSINEDDLFIELKCNKVSDVKNYLEEIDEFCNKNNFDLLFFSTGTNFESDSIYKKYFKSSKSQFLNWTDLVFSIIKNCVTLNSGFYQINCVDPFENKVNILPEQITKNIHLKYPLFVVDITSNTKIYNVC